MTPEEVIASARRCVGARFRAQGRDPRTGLDCVGVAAVALDKDVPPARYGLRGDHGRMIAQVADAMGLRPIFPGETQWGDLLIVEAGPGQVHMVILTSVGFIHADARLRKVVEVPGRPPWPVLAVWRGCDEEDF
jgi:murein DD-endopeptidase / murein LD-carboxypeptidase